MTNSKYTISLLLFALLTCALPSWAQWESHESVLSQHTWYKIGVTEEGVYALDGETLQSLGIDLASLDPSKIRMFGNVAGMLPEANDAERYDDLTEMAIQVEDGGDGSFDANDRILFYGQGTVKLILSQQDYYEYQRHSYTDTLFYFLCVDSPMQGLRIQEKPSMVTGTSDAVITTFPDVVYHESDELSPYASGRTWYGDLITPQEGHKDFVFELPNLDTDKPLRIVSKVLGRCSSMFPYSIRIGNNLIVNNYSISAYSSQGHEYGHEHLASNMFYLDAGPMTVRYELGSTSANPLLFIDYFIVTFWRQLRLQGHGMAFRLIPSQMTSSVEKVQLAGWNASQVCWEVTDPIRPERQQVLSSSGESYFGISGVNERQYYLFDLEGVKPVASAYRIPNQNLHGLTDAEFLIITPRAFWTPAEALAEFHRQQDGMICQLADIQEIYNEFSTGTADPTAMRDFIRMIYIRSEGRLKYVLLFGKGTHDYRNLKGIGNNFVPTYETLNYPYREVQSMCSDDYFGLMDPEEGELSLGLVDLGLGRLPITTEEQGFDMVEKIKHYADLSVTHGAWKNDYLLMADNDLRTYISYSEVLDKILDTTNRLVTKKKLYVDSYPLVSTPSGKRCPMAHEALMEYFDQGFGVMSYTGHGGTKSLTSELVLSVTDVMSMDNYDHLPLVYTATCEFSKFDNPNVVSCGEHMILNANGGAIALLTSMRPTYGPNNQKLSRSFHKHVFEREGQQTLRFGDIYRRSKADPDHYINSNIVFVLFGDPALRFLYPMQEVQTTFVNSQNTMSDGDFTASGLVTVEGVVKGADGQVDTDFNGVMEVKLYDKISNYTTLGNFDQPMDYAYYHDVLFEGKVTVAAGRFTVQMMVPAENSGGTGQARLSYYAYDTIRQVEANGVFSRLRPVSPDPSTLDDQGPEIHLYWDTPDFVSGDTVNRQGTLYAELFDEQGIYHYNVSIGRDIVLRSDLPGYSNSILNDLYEPQLDDFRRGRIKLPMSELPDGRYEVVLKAWDTQNNSSEVEITLVVAGNTLLAQVGNFPNPFEEETYFTLVNGDVSENLSVLIEVFDIMGRRVAVIEKQTASNVGAVEPIQWDGRSSGGEALKAGLYVYRMQVTDSGGRVRVVNRKMIKK